jgi:hypothetical protein
MPYWTERFCMYGHDTNECGRTKDRFCIRCRQEHDRVKYERRKRASEILAAKQVLASTHRLRVIGVPQHIVGHPSLNYSNDSWRA